MISKYHSSAEYFYLDRSLTDMIKMFSCIMVAVHHYSCYAISTGLNDNLFLQAFSTQGGYLGVAIFFFMSGYGLMMSERNHHLDCISFLKKRLSKVLIPSIVITIVWLPVFCMMRIGGGNSLNVRSLYYELWHWGDDVMWFVKTLCLQYVFFLVYSYFRKITPQYKSMMLIIITFASFFISYSVELRHAISLPLFYIGVWIADNPSLCRRLCNGVLVPGGLMLLMLLICYVLRHTAMVLHVVFNYIVVLIAIVVLSSYRITIAKLPSVVGQSSFDVYLVHNKVLLTLRYFLGIVPFSIFAIICFVTTFIFYAARKRMKI